MVGAQMTGMVIVYQDYTPADAGSRARNAIAFTSWQTGARLLPFKSDCNSRHIGDPRGVPFVKDMLDAAFSTGDERIAIITNNDIIFGNGLGEAIREHCSNHGCYWAWRIAYEGAEPDGGLDLFAVTRIWWEKCGPFFPDLLIGYSWWDNILRRMMQWTGTPEGPRLYFHTPHPGIEMRRNSPAERYNQHTAREWLRANNEPE